MIISLFSLLIYRSCWVCFATDEDDRTAEWVRPCRCRGSTKWVHQACLQRWVDEKQRGNSTARVACPQCNAEYLIVFPKLGIGCPVPRIPAEANPLADHVSATRILCGALVFPTIATIVGKLMFSSVNSNLQRTILGGIAFVAIKGAFKVYFKQQQYLRQAHRKILNYPEQEEA
ncbi:hypothetical protein G4228_010859 [Cervus hanglu yarkandensis]|nr:hypothetical protein G4228_010859 [Cervus hanglu yarkandensis]